MNLHLDIKLFSDTLRAASQHFIIKLEFIEKDYWIMLVLSRLSKSKYVSESVFKGGTSLSKGYNLIERFSEDVDKAVKQLVDGQAKFPDWNKRDDIKSALKV
ncbi:MAG: nucleotidyl transferase AbiEii/AbiGii toxin family protein [Bacteroidales bacterium]